jgi:N-acetylmuramoyl-L-alanine amidase
MFKNVMKALTVLWLTLVLTAGMDANSAEPAKEVGVIEVETYETVTVEPTIYSSSPVKAIEYKTLVKSSHAEVEKYSEEDIELIALVTMAEAEGESEQGKRLVIDTILNRVDSELAYMPDTVYDVVYQNGAFSSMWNGRVDRVEATDEVIELVREEIEERTNHDVLYFHANKYGKYGTPLFSEGNHYFSGV